MSLDPVAEVAIRAGLALLLATSAFAKLRDVGAFAGAVAGYRLLPIALAKPAAGVFIAAELAIAAALFVPGLHVAAAIGGASLLGLYTVAIAWNLARGRRDIDCGCGGPLGRQRISEALVIRNALLIVTNSVGIGHYDRHGTRTGHGDVQCRTRLQATICRAISGSV